MQARKIFKLLEAMSETDRDRFGLFLHSPLHNQSALVTALFTELRMDLPKPEAEIRSPQQVHAALPTDSRFSPNYFDKLCAMLVKLLHDFLAWQEFEREQSNTPALLMRAYHGLNLGEAIPGLYKALSMELDALGGSDEGVLEARYKLEREYGMFVLRQPRTPSGDQLACISQALQVSYIDRALEIGIGILNYNQVFKLQIPAPDLSWAVAEVNANPTAWPLLLRVKLLGFRILAHHDIAAFEQILEKLESHAPELDASFRREMYTVALNFCAFRINEGDHRMLKPAEILYMKLLEMGWLLRNGLLPSEQFKNIVSLRLRAGELAWTAQFIEAYGERLTNPHDGLALKYNRAVLKFFEGEYDTCIRMFDEVVRDVKSDMYYGTDARVFMLKALYDRNRPDDTYLIDSQWNAFRVYIIRNKRLGETDQKQYLSFAKLYRKLLTIRENAAQHDQLRKLSAALKGQPLSDRHWFESKIAIIKAQ